MELKHQYYELTGTHNQRTKFTHLQKSVRCESHIEGVTHVLKQSSMNFSTSTSQMQHAIVSTVHNHISYMKNTHKLCVKYF
jgi:hypothetical protein